MPTTNQRPLRRWRTVLLVAAAAAFSLASSQAQKPLGPLRVYPGENIAWRPCGQVADREVECSDIDVPMDQFDAENSAGKTFNLPLIRMRGRYATQNLLLNPGGPGESGMGFIYTDGRYLHDIVGDGFHLLSFDPRGVNKSRPTARCYPNQKTRQNKFRMSDPDPFSRSEERFAWTHNYVQGCVDMMGEHGKYINTPQVAADMNSILDAVGQSSLYFWGFSYGTLLGQTYAAMFPERSSRVIIDGVSDYFDWYESPILKGDFVDTMNVFDGFFEECIRSGDACALASRARSKEELRRQVMASLGKLKKQPIPVYVNATTQGVLNYAAILNGAIYSHLFTPNSWPMLARHLAQLMDGNATEAWLRYGRDEASDTIDEANDIIDLNDGASGPSFWPRTRTGLVEFLKPWYESSPFFFQMNREYYAKQQWSIPRTHKFVPRKRVHTVHPMLIVQTTYDPVCPMVSAKGARDVFADSRLVEIKGYGHCSMALPSLCLAKHVRAYLGNGTLPERHTLCGPDRPYFVSQTHTEIIMARSLAAKTEDDKIRDAQLALSRERRWRLRR